MPKNRVSIISERKGVSDNNYIKMLIFDKHASNVLKTLISNSATIRGTMDLSGLFWPFCAYEYHSHLVAEFGTKVFFGQLIHAYQVGVICITLTLIFKAKC